MQNSRRKGLEFVQEYGAQLGQIMPEAYAGSSEVNRSKMMRMISIWEERQVLGAELLAELRQRILHPAGSSPKPSTVSPTPVAAAKTATPSPRSGASSHGNAGSQSGVSPRSASSPRPPISASHACNSNSTPKVGASGDAAHGGSGPSTGVSLYDMLETLEEGGLVDELLAEREADLELSNLETEVADDDQRNKQQAAAAQAVEMLKSHVEQLKQELEQRQQLILHLAESCEKHNEQCQRTQASLIDCNSLLGRAQRVFDQLSTAQDVSNDDLPAAPSGSGEMATVEL